MDLAEQSKHCPEDRLPSVLDDIRPILKKLLNRMTNESVTRFVYEFARPAASSPPVVIDRKVKAIVDQLPTHVIHLFTDMLIDLIERTYAGGSYGVSFDPNSKSFVLTANVSRLLKEHLKVFVVKDYLMITGTDKDVPPAIPQLLALHARIDNILKMPSCLYSRDELAAFIIEDHEQPGSRELKIVVPKTEVLVVDNPRVFQLNLVTRCAHEDIMSSAAVAARSQQQLKGGTAAASKYHSTTYASETSGFGANSFPVTTNLPKQNQNQEDFGANSFPVTTNLPKQNQNQEDFGANSFPVTTNPPKQNQNQEENDFEIPPKTFKSFFNSLFTTPPSPDTPFKELLRKFMDLAEMSACFSEDRLPSILDDIRPVLRELLYRMTNRSVTRFVYEFARPAASSPPPVIDSKIKAIVDQLPCHVIHLFIDMLIEMIQKTYAGGSYSLSFHSIPNSIELTADVSDIGKEHLKLFVVEDYLMVTGPDKDAPPATATIHNILNMPSWRYPLNEVNASIIEDQEQGTCQLNIVIPKTEVLVDKPRVFQLNLDTKGAHQG